MPFDIVIIDVYKFILTNTLDEITERCFMTR